MYFAKKLILIHALQAFKFNITVLLVSIVHSSLAVFKFFIFFAASMRRASLPFVPSFVGNIFCRAAIRLERFNVCI